MLRFWKCGLFCCGFLATILALSLHADDEKTADKAPAGKSDKPAAKTEEKPVDLDKVPEGTNAELLDYIKKVMSTPPKSEEEQTKMIDALRKASEKILESNPNEQELTTAFMVHMQMPMSPEESKAFLDKMNKIGAGLTKSGKADLGRLATSFTFLARFRTTDDSKELKKAIEEALKFLGESKLQKNDLRLASAIAQAAEQAEDEKFTAATLEKIVAMFKESKLEGKEKEFAEKFAKQLEGVIRRIKLPGNKIELEGHLLSGEKLDLAKYKDKVLLVDFWATWCGPCVGEIPNMKKNYEAYHDKGFEIIGLSCDDNQETVEKFVKEREVPWGIVYGDKAPSPSFEYYGISGIPTMILVGKDGKVISTSARGEELDKLLEKQFGSADKKTEKKDPKKLQLKK